MLSWSCATHRTISCPSCRARSATPRSSSPRCIAADSTANSWSFGMVRRRAAIARSPERIVITRILSARAFERISARHCSGSTPSGELTSPRANSSA